MICDFDFAPAKVQKYKILENAPEGRHHFMMFVYGFLAGVDATLVSGYVLIVVIVDDLEGPWPRVWHSAVPDDQPPAV